MSDETKQIIRALIRMFEFGVSLLRKVLVGEKI